MRVNLFKITSHISSRKLRQSNYSLNVFKIKKLLRTPSIKVGSVLSVMSLLLIISPLFFEQSIDWFSIWQNLGFNLLGAVCAFIAFDVIFLQLKKLDEEQGIKLDFFDKSEFINRVKDLKDLHKISVKSRVNIRIIETWTDLLKDDNYKEKFSQAIIECLDKSSNEIEILLLNPDNQDLVEARSAELQSISDNFSSINITENIYLNLREIQNIIQQLKFRGNQDRFKVKLYNNAPSLAMYMCAPHLFVTFFRSGKLTTMSEQLKLHIDSPVSLFINHRFEEIWQDTKTLSLESCLYVKLEVFESGNFQGTYDKVKYIFCEQGYYLQNANLFRYIANKENIIIQIYDKLFQPKDISVDDLPTSVRKLFHSKYIDYGDIFISLDLLNP